MCFNAPTFNSSIICQLTPISFEEGAWVKRDDLFAISPAAEIRGGKLRQCLLLVQGANSRLISAASIFSPQTAIVPYVARHFGLPCTIIVGGRQETKPLTLARRFGAAIVRCNSGRHTVLFANARKLAAPHDLIVPFGMRPNVPSHSFYDVCSRQVRNVPSNINTIVIASGSGVTATVVAYGLWKERRTDMRLALINVGPDRRLYILETLKKLEPACAAWADQSGILRFYPVGQNSNFRYESRVKFRFGRIDLHPLYEAKAFRWFVEHVAFDAARTLFWLTGPPLL